MFMHVPNCCDSLVSFNMEHFLYLSFLYFLSFLYLSHYLSFIALTFSKHTGQLFCIMSSSDLVNV